MFIEVVFSLFSVPTKCWETIVRLVPIISGGMLRFLLEGSSRSDLVRRVSGVCVCGKAFERHFWRGEIRTRSWLQRLMQRSTICVLVQMPITLWCMPLMWCCWEVISDVMPSSVWVHETYASLLEFKGCPVTTVSNLIAMGLSGGPKVWTTR